MKYRKIIEFKKGLIGGVRIAIAYIPSGITIGLISKDFDQKIIQTAITSFGMYAGSAHSLLLKSLYVVKAIPIEIIISIILINFRYVFLNMIIYQKMRKDSTFLQKILVGIGLTDETVAYISIKNEKSPFYMIGVNTLPYFSYCFSTLIGYQFGYIIPSYIMQNMNFVLYASFFSLLVSAVARDISKIKIVLLTLFIKSVFTYTFLSNFFSSGSIMTLTIFLSSLIYSLSKSKSKYV